MSNIAVIRVDSPAGSGVVSKIRDSFPKALWISCGMIAPGDFNEIKNKALSGDYEVIVLDEYSRRPWSLDGLIAMCTDRL